MARQVDLISSINDTKETWKILCRVVRVWNYMKNGSEDEINTIEVIFVDDKGDTIRGTVRKFLTKKFKDVLVEGKCFLVQHFHVEPNTGDYSCTKHAWKIVFNRSSVIVQREVSISAHGFDFRSFEDILQHKCPEKCLIDVIGEVSFVSDMIEHTTHNGTTKRIEVVLSDRNGNQLKCVLWGSYAEFVSNYIKENKESVTVMVFQLCRIKTFASFISVTNSLQASKILFNPTIPESDELKKAVNLADESISLRHTQASTFSSYNLREDFLYLTPRKTITDIASSLETGKFITLATVQMMQTDQPWFYEACSACKKKFNTVDGRSNCFNCNKPPPMIIPKFRIQMLVHDSKTKLSFVVFEPDAATICKITASEIRDRLVKDDECFDYPYEIEEGFLNKSFLFKVDIAQNNIRKIWQSFTVVRMTNDEEIIADFIKLYGNMKCEDASITEVQYQQNNMRDSNLNDTFSITSENEIDITSSKAITPCKRNTQDLEGDDCTIASLISPQSSVTKIRVVPKREKND